MNKGLVWWSDPTDLEGIEPYVSQVTAHLGEGIWAKLMRDVLTAEWKEIITTGTLAELPDDGPKRKR